MITYTLTQDELATFSQDDVRAAIRSRLASEHLGEDVIIIADEEGNEWDRLESPTEPEVIAEMAPTSQELEAKLEQSEELKEAVRIDESVTRPIVMRKLQLEARAEFRSELRAKDETILSLRAENARLRKEVAKAGQAKKAEKGTDQ